MAEPGDILRVQATESKALAQRIVDTLTADLAAATAAGDEIRATQIRANLARVKVQEIPTGAQAETVQEATAALREQATVSEQVLAIEERTLAVLNEQYDMRLAAENVWRDAREKQYWAQLPAAEYPAQGMAPGEYQAALLEHQAMYAAQHKAAAEAEATAAAERTAAALAAQVAEARAIVRAALDEREAEIAAADALERQKNLRAQILAQTMATARETGMAAAFSGKPISAETRLGIIGGPQGAEADAIGGKFAANERSLVRYNLALGEYDAFASRAEMSTTALTGGLTRLGIAQVQASDAMRRHGALTTEFLSALGRGETTIQELGYQVGATIGKFAGWTAAATATYGALGAVFELGKGAVDSASSVQMLTRTIENVNTDRAAQQIRQLSADVNVNMKEAGNTVFLFSRTFHNVDDAVTAARLALSAYKLDGVQVQDSVKAMTALHQQFGLSAQQLVPVFDELAQGQQRFNARITDQIPLLQRSAGAVKAMGGDLNDFIKISTIFLRTTQLSGSQGGTAFARSAANFLNPQTSKGQANRAVLQALGIDPNQNYTDLVFDALRKSVNFSNAQRRELALAMFGPQLGARTAGFWAGGGNMLDQVQREMTRGASRGVLQVELEKQLRSAREEIEKVVTGLQRIGSALAETGLLSPLGLMLRGLVGIENVVEHLIELFDHLPRGVRETLALVLEMRIAMLALSRTQIGQSVGALPGIRAVTGIIPGARPSAEQRLRTDAVIGTRQVISTIDAEITATGSKLGQITASTARLQAQLARYNAQLAEVDISSAEGVRLMERSNATYQSILAQQREQVRLEQLQADNLAAQRAYQTQLVGLQRGTIAGPELAALGAAMGAGTQAAEGEAGKIGIGEYAQARYGQVMNRLRGVLMSSAAAERAAGSAAAGAAAAMTANAQAADQAIVEFEVMDARLQITGEAFTTLGTDTATIGDRLRILDAQLAAVSSEIAVVDEAVVQTEVQLSITSAALTSLGEVWTAGTAALTGLASSLFSFTGLLIAAPLIWEAISHSIEQDNQATRSWKSAMDDTATNMKGFEQHVKDLQDAASKYTHAANSMANRMGRTAQFLYDVANLPNPFLGGDPGKDFGDPTSTSAHNFANQVAQLQRNMSDEVKQFQKDANALVKTQAGRRELAAETGRVVGGWQRLLAAALPGHPEEQAKELLILRDELQTAYQRSIDALARSGGSVGGSADPFAGYRGASVKTLMQNMQAWADRMKVYGPTPDLLHRMATLYAYIASQYARSTSDADLQKVDQARSQYLDAVGQSIQNLLDEAKAAHGKREKLTLIHQANELLKAAKQDLSDTENILRKDVVTARAAYEANVVALAGANYTMSEADKQIAQGLLDNAKQAEASGAIIGGAFASVDRALAKIVQVPEALKRNLEAAVRDSKKQYDAAKAALGGLDAATNSLFAQLDQKQADINQAQKSASKSSQGPASQDPYAIAKLQRELAAAYDEYDPVKAAQDAITEAQLEVKGARNQTERLHALIDLVHAEHQLDNAVEDQRQATFTLAESLTTDPLKQAIIEMHKAAQKVAFDSTHGGLETTQALQDRAAYNKAVQARIDQAITSREDTIKFHLDLNQITTQQAVAEYQGLLKMHGITTAMRRQIIEAIYQLKHQTDSQFGNLALGTIRLPTPYEIRRATQAAAGGISVNQHYSTTIQVSDVASARQVGVVMDNWHRGVGKAVARATARR